MSQEQNEKVNKLISSLSDDHLRKVFQEMFIFNTVKEKNETFPCENTEVLLEVMSTIIPAEPIKKSSNIEEGDEEMFNILYALELFAFTYKKVTIEYAKRFMFMT